MKRCASLFLLIGLLSVWLTGCHDADAPPPPPPAPSGPVTAAPGGKDGVKPTMAPTVGVNPDFNGAALGSKGK